MITSSASRLQIELSQSRRRHQARRRLRDPHPRPGRSLRQVHSTFQVSESGEVTVDRAQFRRHPLNRRRPRPAPRLAPWSRRGPAAWPGLPVRRRRLSRGTGSAGEVVRPPGSAARPASCVTRSSRAACAGPRPAHLRQPARRPRRAAGRPTRSQCAQRPSVLDSRVLAAASAASALRSLPRLPPRSPLPSLADGRRATIDPWLTELAGDTDTSPAIPIAKNGPYRLGHALMTLPEAGPRARYTASGTARLSSPTLGGVHG